MFLYVYFMKNSSLAISNDVNENEQEISRFCRMSRNLILGLYSNKSDIKFAIKIFILTRGLSFTVYGFVLNFKTFVNKYTCK